jgi:hypothetical protein
LVGRQFLDFVRILQFHEIGDVEEGIALQSNVHEGGLHARQDPGDAAFVDRTGQGVFIFAFQVDFSELIVFD